jgi:prepilin-type N-terminal cleavage/methylation domain-containing protein
MTPTTAPRRGVTLVELLVVISILTGLFALALMVIPNINQKDAVSKGAGEIQAAFKTAQGMAAAAKLPRGVRFIVPAGAYTASTLQYLEMPPVVVCDPQALVAINGDTFGANTPYGPRVQLSYVLSGPPSMTNTTPMNAIVARHCYLRGLTLDQAAQVGTGATLMLPTLNSYSLINSASWIPPQAPFTSTAASPGPYTYTSPRTGATVTDLEAILNVYPDPAMGTSAAYQTYQFGIYGVGVPLLAEPTVVLPQGIAADLQISYPPLATAGVNYDVMFSPNGPTVSTVNVAANTNVYIWVRDITKITNPGGSAAKQTSMNGQYPTPPGDFPSFSAYYAAFPLAGDQLVVGVRSGGFIGNAPINWPPPNGVYVAPQDPFSLARAQLTR